MKRAHALDAVACPRCRGKMSMIALIDDEQVAVRILDHLGLASRVPPRDRPWRSGQQWLALEQAGGALDGIASRSPID